MANSRGLFARLVGKPPVNNIRADVASPRTKISADTNPKAAQSKPLRFSHLKPAPVVAMAAPAPVRITKADQASRLASQMISAARGMRVLITDPVPADRLAQAEPAPDPSIEAAAKNIAAKMIAAAGRGVRF